MDYATRLIPGGVVDANSHPLPPGPEGAPSPVPGLLRWERGDAVQRMIPLIETGGSWRDIGYDAGVRLREQFRCAAASCRAELGGIEPADVVANIEPYWRITQEVAPDVIAELHGMAEGSGVPFVTLFVLNAGAELTQ